jgi:methionyl-tRNA formyltransferase
MRVVILKGDSPRHNYFASQLLTNKGIDFKIISPRRLGTDRLRKMFLKSPKTFFTRITKYIFLAYLQWNKKESLFFGTHNIEGEQKVDNINGEHTISLIKEFSPDLIVAFGVPIVSSKILDIPRFKAINLHGGISPDYKGGNTIFWPLFEGKPELAGATLHYMIKNVDSGRIIAKVYPDINPNDNELSVSCKTFKYATAEMMKIISWIKENDQLIPGEEQFGKGKLYLAKHRTFRKDLTGMKKIKKNLKEVNLPLRIQRSY